MCDVSYKGIEQKAKQLARGSEDLHDPEKARQWLEVARDAQRLSREEGEAFAD